MGPCEDMPWSGAPRSPQTGCDLAKRGTLPQTGGKGTQPGAGRSGELHVFGGSGFRVAGVGSTQRRGSTPRGRESWEGRGTWPCPRLCQDVGATGVALENHFSSVGTVGHVRGQPPGRPGRGVQCPPGLPAVRGQLTQPFLKRWSHAARLPGPRHPHGEGRFRGSRCLVGSMVQICATGHLRVWASGPTLPNCFLPGP